MKKTFKIEVDCAVCAQKCERAMAKVKGVISVSINFMQLKMVLEANDEEFDEVLKACEKAARKVEPDFEIFK